MTITPQTVRFSSYDQNMWATGDRSAIEWHEYVPIIGGDREYFSLVDAQIVGGAGKVTIDGERLNWDPEGRYDRLANGDTATITIEYVLEDDSGARQTHSIQIEARGTLAGTGYVIPETGQTSVDAMNFAVLDARDILQQQHSFDTVTPIDVDFDAMAAFQPVIDQALGDLARAEARTENLYLRAQAASERADAELAAAHQEVAHIGNVLAKMAIYDVANGAAQVAAQTYQVAQNAKEAWDDANVTAQLRQAAVTTAQQAFNVAQTALDTAEAAETLSRSLLSSAEGALNDLIDQVQNFGGFVPPFIRDAFAWIADFLGISDDIDAANDAVDAAQDAFSDAVSDVIEAQSVLSGAQSALDAAQSAANAALNALADRAEELTEALAGKSLAALNRLKDQAENAADAARDDWLEARQDMWDDGILVGRNPTKGDALNAAEAVTSKAAVAAAAEIAETGAYAAWQAAQAMLNGALDSADNTDVTLEASASVTLDAQAGLQVDLVMDGGSVDSNIDYEVSAETSFDAAADTLTLNALATNQTTGESVAFETVSPNMSLYAGIVYNVDAHFEMLFDLYAKVAGVELADLGPYAFSETLSLAGWIDILDVDTTDLGSFDVPIPTWVGDILSLEVAIPTVETQGREHAVDASVYTDPTGISMDEVAAAILTIAETRLDFSPEFRALLIEQGMREDVTSSDLGQALADALGAILNSVVADEVVPIFMIDNTDAGVDGIVHINNIADVIDEIDINEVGELGFFYGEGDSGNMFQVSVDVDQLVATAVNVALKNAPDTTINPLDLSIGMDTIAEKAGIPAKVMDKIKKYVKVEFGVEAADFDVRAGANVSQKFALSVDDMAFQVTFEDGTTGLFNASEGGEIVIENASDLVDTNGDGDIDYTLSLTPDATLFNDTQIGLNIGYTLDFIKAQAELAATLPLDEVFKDVDWSALGFEIPTDILSKGIDFNFGPVLRAEGDLDLLSADLFEDIFAYNAGSTVVEGSFVPVTPPVEEEVAAITGTEGRDVLIGTGEGEVFQAFGGRDVIRARGGDDTAEGGAGRDKVLGQAGNDVLSGGAGRDKLLGQAGRDALDGGTGPDLLRGHRGDDTMTGGAGEDTFVLKRNDGTDTVTDFEIGADVIRILNGAEDLDDLSFDQQGNDVMVSFANVEVLVQGTLVADMAQEANFDF